MGTKRIASSTLCALFLGGGGGRVGGAFSVGSVSSLRSGHQLQLPQPSQSSLHLKHQQQLNCHHRFYSSTTATHPIHRRTWSSLAMTSSSPSPTGSLVTIAEALAAHKHTNATPNSSEGRAVFLDGSWHMPVGPTPRNGRVEYTAGPRIAGACYFDIDDIAPSPGSHANPKALPHMKPSSKQFACAMDQMGITPDDTLYVYATHGCAFYHRAYWTLACCGYHDPAKVKLVQGSLDAWKEAGGEVEEGALNEDDPRLFRMNELEWETATPKYKCWKESGEDTNMESTVTMAQVREVVEQTDAPDALVVDARSAGRFYGKDPEPRPGLRGGHMPGAVNVPFVSLLDPNDPTKYRSMEEVRALFVGAGVGPLEGDGSEKTAPRKVICSCGSGVTAAALAVGLEECGLRRKEDIAIYDGSWIEWGGDEGVPIVTD